MLTVLLVILAILFFPIVVPAILIAAVTPLTVWPTIVIVFAARLALAGLRNS